MDPLEEKRKELLEVHPLSVEVKAGLENGLSITLKFQYLTKLKIITVTSSVAMPPNITGKIWFV